MSEAFVLSTPVRRAVFADLAAGETDLARIVAKNRLIRPAAERAAKELAERGLVVEEGGALRLTEAGERVRHALARDYI